MLKPFLVLVVSIALLPNTVNARSGLSRERQIRLQSLYNTVLSSGAVASLDKGRAAFLSIDPGTPERVEELYGDEDASDGFDHGCELFLGRDQKTIEAVVFRVSTMTDAEHSQSYYFRLDPQGNLKRTVVTRALYHDDKPVRGAGRAEIMEKGAPGIEERLQHELDFWLKGMYRKKKSDKK